MYEITNTTKKEGHTVGQHKNGWHVGLTANYFLGPGKTATIETINQDYYELQRQGLISVKDVGNKKMAPAEVVAPIVTKTASLEADAIQEAAYPDGEPNFVVRAPSLNTETELAAEDAPAVTIDSLKAKSARKR